MNIYEYTTDAVVWESTDSFWYTQLPCSIQTTTENLSPLHPSINHSSQAQ